MLLGHCWLPNAAPDRLGRDFSSILPRFGVDFFGGRAVEACLGTIPSSSILSNSCDNACFEGCSLFFSAAWFASLVALIAADNPCWHYLRCFFFSFGAAVCAPHMESSLEKTLDLSSVFVRFFLVFRSSISWKCAFYHSKTTNPEVFAKITPLRFSSIFLPTNLPKTFPKRGPNPSKIDGENVLFFNIDFLGFRHRFWRVLGPQDPPRCLQRQAC